MSDRLRSDAGAKRDHLTPADLLSDDPEKSVDPSTIRTRTQSDIGPGTCAALRDALRGCDQPVEQVAEQVGATINDDNLRQHYRGRCEHDHDAPPVRYNFGAAEWQTHTKTDE